VLSGASGAKSVIAGSTCDEAIQLFLGAPGLLRGARNDGEGAAETSKSVIAGSPCDEAIQLFALPSGLLRCARNDVEGAAETREFVIARSPCDEAIQIFALPSELLRCARNDVERTAETSKFVIARSTCDDRVRRSSKSEGGSNRVSLRCPLDCLAARDIEMFWWARQRARIRARPLALPTLRFLRFLVCYRPIFSHSHRATASGELAPSPPAARRLASRMVAMSILPSNGPSAARKTWSSARFGASSTIAS
jgi:hypothetical protein